VAGRSDAAERDGAVLLQRTDGDVVAAGRDRLLEGLLDQLKRRDLLSHLLELRVSVIREVRSAPMGV
jgi:hypothetical protein